MVVLDVDMLVGGFVVWQERVKIGWGIGRRILVEEVPRREDTCCLNWVFVSDLMIMLPGSLLTHVIETRFRDGSVLDVCNQVIAKVGGARIKGYVAWHRHLSIKAGHSYRNVI